MSHQDYLDLAPLYALGALDGEDLSKFHEHLSECRECRKLVGEHAEAASGIAAALDPITPPPALRDKLLSKARAATKTPAPSTPATMKEPLKLPTPAERVGSWATYLLPVAAAAAFLIGILIGWESGESPLIEKYQEAIETARKLKEQQDADKKFMATAQKVMLKGTEKAPKATALVMWNEDRVMVVGDEMPLSPPGRMYVLWALMPDGNHINLGESLRDSGGNLNADMAIKGSIAKHTGFAVSDEADRNTPKPTGSLWLLPTP